MLAVIAIGSAIGIGRHRCASLCAEREYAFKGYAPGSWLGSNPAVCTCGKDGTLIKVPMR